MNISEILRALLDKLEAIEGGDMEPSMEPEQEPSMEPKMMPPLTQKTELLKKAVGVDSEFDEVESDCGCDDSASFDDELADIKKRAGIMVLSDDSPFES